MSELDENEKGPIKEKLSESLEKSKEVLKILKELRERMDEIETLKKELGMKRLRNVSISRTKKSLEEIKVPSLDFLDVKKKKVREEA